ncbi:glycosyltransferase family 1 protein [Romeria aff. gracilis LEGE 07310]|uniref:Glycosyltransferase family 1 protein n=1 Tax=Vasconcelosia minhoensis LEGE 07310 TaxID=915328 RepID=A0A8J7A8J5_9CYAN|nr:glycosyltransferase family 1 protein [Romeria gracilis]MBE9078025.1 glycosyltransferase family 1 protein [Romeria aff. gracilis LEGE 07310]
MPPIAFYIPPTFWPPELPTSAEQNWAGFGLGIYAWTLQTYLRLRAVGFPCELVDRLPAEGIVLFHSNAARATQPRPSAKRLLICLKAESYPYPYAQLQVVQNPVEASARYHRYFTPHWPQPGLMARSQFPNQSPGRPDRFETVAFFGHANSLAPELQTSAWEEALAELGLRWQPVINTNHWNDFATLSTDWNDYRAIDAIVAVRSFSAWQQWLQGGYRHKPATKLYNAWLAGVPAILGPEVAYRAERRSPLDYLEVTSMPDLIAQLRQLKSDSGLRQAMVVNGRDRASAYSPAAITQRWQQFLEAVAIPAYDRWCKQPAWRRTYQLLPSVYDSYRSRTVNKASRLLIKFSR